MMGDITTLDWLVFVLLAAVGGLVGAAPVLLLTLILYWLEDKF